MDDNYNYYAKPPGKRLERFGVGLLNAVFWISIVINSMNILFMISGLADMMTGSCSAALVGVMFSLPLVILSICLFALGLILAGSMRNRSKMGMIGLALSVASIPFWLYFGLIIAFIIGAG